MSKATNRRIIFACKIVTLICLGINAAMFLYSVFQESNFLIVIWGLSLLFVMYCLEQLRRL